MIFERATKQLIYHFPSRASEWAASVILFNWGFLIWMTNGAILQYTCPPMLNIMEPSMWALSFLGLSTVRVALLIINGTLRRSPHLRSACSFISCFAWFQITLSAVNADPITTDVAVYPILLALDFYNAYRTAIEARVTDEGYKDAAGGD